MPTWLVWLTAGFVAYAIWKVGTAMLRGLGRPAPGVLDEAPPPAEPEDVDDLDVFLECVECGTEFKVSKLGELQIPRHCGEKMQVIRRPRSV